jgi:hypothetical protein
MDKNFNMEKYHMFYMINEENVKIEITKEEFEDFSNSIWYDIEDNILIFNENTGYEIMDMED